MSFVLLFMGVGPKEGLLEAQEELLESLIDRLLSSWMEKQ